MSTRIALKYCGGCDPEFDRVGLFAKVRSAAADSIEWVGLDDFGFNTVLVIAGCARACPAQRPEIALYRAIFLQNDRLPAAEIIQALLSEGEQ
jgi:hypothetical protein